MDDHEEFAVLARHVLAVAEPFLEEMFGPRCEDVDADCECCKRWAALDTLVANPFEVNDA